MQGQRSTVDSLPETFEFEHGSTSNTGVNQQLFWNNMLNPVESHLPEYMLAHGETGIMGGNAVNHESRSFSGWGVGEPSSSGNARSHVCDETKTEHGWSSSLSTSAGISPRLEERQFEPSSILSVDTVNVNLNGNQVANGPFFVHNSGTDGITQNINLNASYVGSSSNGEQAMEADVSSHSLKSGGSDIEQLPSSSGSSDPLGTAVASSGYILEEIDGRPGCSLDGRRLSCKRKAFEGASGQPSLGGGPSWFQRAESSAWHAVPAQNNGASSSIVPTPENSPSTNPAEQLNPRFAVGMRVAPEGHPGLSVSGGGESSQRNFRVRVNRPQPQDSGPPNPLSTGSAIRRSHVWSSNQASRLLPFNQPSESRPLSSAQANANALQGQSHAMHIPGLARNVHPFPWNGSSNSRAGSSSSSGAGERSAALLREEANPRSVTRTIAEHPMFAPANESRTPAQDPTNWGLPGGNISILGHTASTSRISSSSGVHPPPGPTWIPPQNLSSLYPQRLSDFARRSLFPSVSSESGVQANTFPALRPGPSGSSQEMVLPSGVNHQGHHQPHPRSAFWTERHGDGVPGVPFSLRTLAAAGEGRSRLIRNVLDLMRRGESLRFEDVLILDQSVFYGVADLHDRHRDMRLDVDNMSYEELLALEERIGNVSTGLSEETVLKCLKQRKYFSITIGPPTEVEEPCCICQEEYVDGEDMGTLDCGHDFHAGCIKQWLMHKNLCPICKTTALVT